jgi:DHA2 family multidrug resistance protein
MSNTVAILEVKPLDTFGGESILAKIGLLGAICSLVMLDGVNGAVCSTLGKYLTGGFAVTTDQIVWASIFYYVAKLYMLLLAARTQERFGQRRALLGASMVLVLATAGGWLAADYPSLLAALFLQGACGGLMVALGQGALLAAFPRREQPLVQASYMLATAMFPATIVPALLGGCAYNFDWQDAYVWLLPLGALGSGWLFWKRKSLSNPVVPISLPIVRATLLAIALFAIVYVLQQGNRNCWFEYPPIVWSLLLAVTCIVGIGFIETSGGPTFLRYAAFRYANFTYGSTVVVFAGIALFGSGYVISGFATGVLDYPVSQSGLVQLSGTVFATVSFLMIGIIIRSTKIPGVYVVRTGWLIFGAAMWNLGYAPSDLNFEGFASSLIVRGFALGCQFIPGALAALTCLPPQDDVAAAGLFNFNRQMGALIGVAWLQTLHEHLTDRNQTVFGNALSSVNPNTMSYAQAAQHALSLYGTPSWEAPPAAMAITLQEAQRQWASIAYNGCFESLALLFFFSFPVVILGRVLATRFLKPPYVSNS